MATGDLTNGKTFVKNPYSTGQYSGEIIGVYLASDEEVHWSGITDSSGRFVVTGYSIIKRFTTHGIGMNTRPV